MTQESTSEEKLLGLIRQKRTAPLSGAKAKSPKPSSRAKGAKHQQSHPLDGLNAALVLVCTSSLIFLGVRHFLEMPHEGTQPLNIVMNTEGPRTSPARALPKANPFHVYEQTFLRRDYFSALEEKPQVNVVTAQPSAPTPDLSQHLNIVGIVLDQDSKVIIEDKKTKQTFFVSEGERVHNAILKTIQENKVTFDYNGQLIELIP